MRVLLATLVLCLTTAGPALAALQLTLTESVSGASSVTVDDTNAAPDANPATGAITFVGAVGAWTINVSTGLAAPIMGPAHMDLNSVNLIPNVASTLTISFTQTDITTPFPGWELTFGATLPPSTTVTVAAYQDNSNVLHGTANQIGSLSFGPFGVTTGVAGQTSGAVAGVTAPYSLTQQIIIATTGITGQNSYSGNFALEPVPEPATLLLLGSGLVGAGFWGRKRRTAKTDLV